MDRRLLVTLLALFALTGFTMSQEKNTSNNRIFEMRTYYAHQGRMAALDARFRDHTCKLFEKHGIQLVGFWKPTGKADEVMVYILAYPSNEAAEKSWKAFREDPVWIKAKEDSEKSGPIVKKVESVFLSPTDYSPIK
jgi:hypothetical protein